MKTAGPGFINFWLDEEYLKSIMLQYAQKKFNYPKLHLGNEKQIIVEFAHPNTHKPFHIGHLRNIILGESISRLLGALDNKIIRANYQGDVGLHIAKCLYGIRQSKANLKNLKSLDEKTEFLGKMYINGNTAYENDKNAKKKILDINHKIYAKDQEIMQLWRKTRQWSLDYFDKIYSRIYTKFDRLYFESEVSKQGLKIAQKSLNDEILHVSEGAVVFKGDKYGLDTRVFITQEGNPTYEAKELGLAELEFSEFGNIDKVLHVVAPEQISFFEVTFKVEELIDPKLYKDKQYHLVYGYVNLKEGKMSSRKGTIIKGNWLLDEVKNKILDKFDIDDSAAEIITIGAVKYSMLKVDPKSDMTFSINESISLEGNSGPYLQYTYARCNSVLEKAGKNNLTMQQFNNETIKSEELSILRTLYKFPEVVLEAGKTYSPNIICNYLFNLAQRYNTFYNKHKIIKSKDEKFRLILTSATAQVLKNGLNLLGIKTLEKM